MFVLATTDGSARSHTLAWSIISWCVEVSFAMSLARQVHGIMVRAKFSALAQPRSTKARFSNKPNLSPRVGQPHDRAHS